MNRVGGDIAVDSDWLDLARDAYRSSTTYFDASLRKRLEKNYDLFRGKHPSGSKYRSPDYKYRSKIFRPKTRATIQRAEAAVAQAFFSTSDVVAVLPENPSDKAQHVSAAVLGEVLNYRLEKYVPWYLTLVGAFQDASIQGVCISKQEWKLETTTKVTPVFDQNGNLVYEDGIPKVAEVEETVEDRPDVTLIPRENFRFDPGCDWRDPVRTSPYLIHLIPMYVVDVQAKMRGEMGRKWIEYDEADIIATVKEDYDSVRAKREGSRRDSKDSDIHAGAYDIVWVREVFLRKDGGDWVFHTLGDELLLSEPSPVGERYLHCKKKGERPFQVGFVHIEAHKTDPSGDPELLDGLQTEANDVANLRLDNVKLALMRQYFMRRGAKVDTRALTRGIPGGVVQMDDINGDVRADAVPEVTGSSYQEQDRINVDFDELAGSFSQSSVATNRSLNETVGGMNLLSQGADQITEFKIKTFTETWVEPVLRQLVRLEQVYETDQNILNIAGERGKLRQKYGIDQVTDDLLDTESTIRVNVGFGATNPQKRLEKLVYGIQLLGQAFPQVLMQANVEEIVTEIFGALGYRDGQRFFPNINEQNPQMLQAQQMIQQLQQELQQAKSGLQAKQMDVQSRLQVEQMRLADKDKDRQYKAWETIQDNAANQQNTQMEIAAEQGRSVDEIRARLQERLIAAQTDMAKFNREMQVKKKMGKTANYGLE